MALYKQKLQIVDATQTTNGDWKVTNTLGEVRHIPDELFQLMFESTTDPMPSSPTIPANAAGGHLRWWPFSLWPWGRS